MVFGLIIYFGAVRIVVVKCELFAIEYETTKTHMIGRKLIINGWRTRRALFVLMMG